METTKINSRKRLTRVILRWVGGLSLTLAALFAVWLFTKPDVIPSEQFVSQLESGEIQTGDEVIMRVESIQFNQVLGNMIFVGHDVAFVDARQLYDFTVGESYTFEVQEYRKIGNLWYVTFDLEDE